MIGQKKNPQITDLNSEIAKQIQEAGASQGDVANSQEILDVYGKHQLPVPTNQQSEGNGNPNPTPTEDEPSSDPDADEYAPFLENPKSSQSNASVFDCVSRVMIDTLSFVIGSVTAAGLTDFILDKCAEQLPLGPWAKAGVITTGALFGGGSGTLFAETGRKVGLYAADVQTPSVTLKKT